MSRANSRARELAWKNAKQICRLTTRQVEMARALGLNPKKLPRLRPGPHQRWRLPVGEFIEECYRKRFGGRDAPGDRPISRRPSIPDRDAAASERAWSPASRLDDLERCLDNLVDELRRWLAHGSIDPELLRQVPDVLREIATALDTGAPIPAIPAIPAPPSKKRRDVRRHSEPEGVFDDDDIPF